MRFRNREVPEAKNGHRHKIVAVCRISTVHQDERSLDDQLALYREWLDHEYPDGYDLDDISGQGSGEELDRADFLDLTERVDSGEYDCVIAEDLARICRRMHAMIICEAAVDSDTRVVALNDSVDTLEEDWEQNAIFATMKHTSSNRDTSHRIRRSIRNRFSTGQLPPRLPAGYRVPHMGALENECSKAPAAEPVFDEWFDRLERGETFAQIADWLNSINFPLGRFVKKKEWDGTLVGQVTKNTVLKGELRRNIRQSKRVNRTGRRKTVPAPAEMLLVRQVPHLAFIEPERFDRVIRQISRRNEKYRRGIQNARDPRQGRPRSDTRWPSQHLRCGICGRKFVLGGHGRKERMMCDGARSYDCWNAMTVDRPELAQAVAAEIHRQLELLPDFDSELVRQVELEATQLSQQQNTELRRLQSERDRIDREVQNLTDAIARGLSSSAVLSRLEARETELDRVDEQITDAIRQRPKQVAVPTADQIRASAQDSFLDLAVESREFGTIMREMIPEFHIFPYRLFDGGMIMPRVDFQLDLGGIAGASLPPNLDSMSIRCQVDLTRTPQRVEYRERVIQLRASGLTAREAAQSLGITHTAADRAAKLHRKMLELGMSDPWQPVRTDAEASDYFKRIRNERYRFNPLEGFPTRFPDTAD